MGRNDQQLVLQMFQARTGFPAVCPLDGARTCMTHCDGCRYHTRSVIGHWSCEHAGYQDALGVHFCRGCGIELGPWAEVHGWEYCGGPVGQCLHMLYAGMGEDHGS